VFLRQATSPPASTPALRVVGRTDDRLCLPEHIYPCLNNSLLLEKILPSSVVMSIAKIAEVLNTSTTTVMKVKKSYFEKGAQATLKRKRRKTPPIEAKITGEVEAKIIALSCGEPPEGYSRWTLRLLADKSVELGIITGVSHASVGSILKKRTKATSS